MGNVRISRDACEHMGRRRNVEQGLSIVEL
jgi:hypothetical protein